MKKRLNVRLLTRVGVVLLAGALVLHVIHRIQLGRHARSFRAQADSAAEREDFSREALYLSRYLSLRPGDVEAEGEYGLTLEKLATNAASRWRAYHVLEKVLRRDPDNAVIRQALGQLAVRLERFDSAARVLEPLRKTRTDQGELEETLGWCHAAAGTHDQAQLCFRESIRRSPGRISAYEGLAALHLRLNQRPAASRVMDELITANPRLARAYVSRGRFHERLGQLEGAAADFGRAVMFAAGEVKVLAEAAEFQCRRGRPDLARPILRRALPQRGSDIRPVLQLAILEHDTGRTSEALAVLREAPLESEPQASALLIEFLLERGQAEEAERAASRLAKESPWASYAEAQRWMHGKEWVRAARRFEELARVLTEFPGWAERVQLALSRCHAACGDAVRCLEASRQAAVPGFRAAQLNLALALAEAGQTNEAIREWKRLMSEAEPPAEGWVGWARAVIRHNSQSALSPPDWNEVDRLLSRADASGGDPVAAALARAESLVLRNQAEQAETLLRTEADRLNGPPALQAALADVLALRGRFDDALAMLKKHNGVEARLARIRYVTHGRGSVPNPSEVLAAAEAGLEQFSPEEAGRILHALAEEARRRSAAGALEWCRRWMRTAPHDLRAFQLFFDLSGGLLQDEDLREAVAGLRRIEGEAGIRWRAAEVMRLLLVLRTPRSDAAALAGEARRLIAEANQLGRGTAAGRDRAARAEGWLEERSGRPAEAVAAYLRAFEEGERADFQVRRLLQLLLDRQQLVEANRVVRLCELQGLAPDSAAVRPREALYPLPAASHVLPPPLARLGCEVALRQHDLRRAVELAPGAVTADATHLDLLWLADVYDRGGRPAEAVRILERLTEQFADVGEVWVTLVRLLVKTGQREKAEDMLARAQRALSNADDLWQLPLGQCNEALGHVRQAERLYRLALQASPGSPLVRRRLAQFLLAGDRPEEAMVHLQALIRSPYESRTQSAWARRALAGVPFQLLALRREPSAQLREQLRASELLAQLPRAKDGKEQPGDERLRALVIAAQRDRLEKGLELFEKTITLQVPLTADERFRRAQLHGLMGNHEKADELMDELLSSEKHNAQYVAGKVQMLLGRDERSQAQVWLRRLQVLEPDAPRTHALRAETGD